MLSFDHIAANLALPSTKALGLALLLASGTDPALAQDTSAVPAAPAEVAAAMDPRNLRAEVAEIEREIAEAEAELAS